MLQVSICVFSSNELLIRLHPDLTGSTSSSISNATVVTCESFKGGTMTLGVRASVLPPSDVFGVFIDGVKETQLIAVNSWRELIVNVPAGRHVIDFSYQYNMFSVDPMPPSPPSREGKSFSTF